MSLPLPPPGRWPWLSIHDVTPATLDCVETLAALIEARQRRATLLIVPGAGWDADSLHRLRALCQRGHPPAGHGWFHHAERWGGWGHRLHAWLISNRAAEHLAMDAQGVDRLIRRCHAWFAANGLPSPALYVPPAWALGPLAKKRLESLPFRFYETMSGVYDAGERRFHRLPLLGFEADRRWRACALRINNRIHRRLAAMAGRWRVALHPGDLQGPLAADVVREIEALKGACLRQAM